jgi:hypothetical protein
LRWPRSCSASVLEPTHPQALEYANAIYARSADETALLVAWTSTGEEDVTRLASADAGDYSAKPSVARRRTGASFTDITEAYDSETSGTPATAGTTASASTALLRALVFTRLLLLTTPDVLFCLLVAPLGARLRVLGFCAEATNAEAGQHRGESTTGKSCQHRSSG